MRHRRVDVEKCARYCTKRWAYDHVVTILWLELIQVALLTYLVYVLVWR